MQPGVVPGLHIYMLLLLVTKAACTKLSGPTSGACGFCIEKAKCAAAQVLAYSAVFLTAASQQRLLAAAPPQHAHVHCDHVTLDYRPTLQQVHTVLTKPGYSGQVCTCKCVPHRTRRMSSIRAGAP